MIHDLDEALRRLLVRELPVRNGEVDISFEQPTRRWMSRLSRPTLNLFLYDIRENLKLRGSQVWRTERLPDGTVAQRRTPVTVNMHYIITAWANDPDDEHSLLGRTLMVLFRRPSLPRELLPEGLQDQPRPISVRVAQPDTLDRPADVWSALDNEMRPAIPVIVVVSIDPYTPIITPVVRTRELRVGWAIAPPRVRELAAESRANVFWSIGGTVRSLHPPERIHLTLVERGIEVELDEEKRFTIGGLLAGEYTLEAVIDDKEPRRFRVSVPAPDYVLEL